MIDGVAIVLLCSIVFAVIIFISIEQFGYFIYDKWRRRRNKYRSKWLVSLYDGYNYPTHMVVKGSDLLLLEEADNANLIELHIIHRVN